MKLFSKHHLDGWSLLSLFIGLIIVIPIITIIIKLFHGPGENWPHISDTLFGRYLINTIILVFGVGFITLLIGVFTAWFVVNCDFPGRSFFEWSLMLPLSIPTYISAIAYAGIFDFIGPIHTLVNNFTTLDPIRVVPDIMNIYGVIFVISMVLYPYVYMVSKSAFLSQSLTIVENSRLLGSSATETFFRIALPMARPFVFGGLVLVLMEVLNDYGAVKYYGVQNFTTGIFKAWFSMGDLNAAIYLSALLLVFVFGILWIEKRQRKNIRYQESSRSFRPIRRYKLTRAIALGLTLFCTLPLLCGFVFPVSQLVYWALGSAGSISGDFLAMTFNSLILAGTGAALCVAVAVILIYTKRINANNLVLKFISQLAVLGYSIPGAVIAVGIDRKSVV